MSAHAFLTQRTEEHPDVAPTPERDEPFRRDGHRLWVRLGARVARRRLYRLGFTATSVAHLTDRECLQLSKWTARSELTVGLYASLILASVYVFDVMRPWRSLAAAFVTCVAVCLLVWGWVGIAYLAWQASVRWGDADRRLGLAARAYLRGAPQTGLDRRNADQRVKWSMRRELYRSTGARLTVTPAVGEDLGDLVRGVLIRHVKGDFVDPTASPARPAEDRTSAGFRDWVTTGVAVIGAATAVAHLLMNH